MEKIKPTRNPSTFSLNSKSRSNWVRIDKDKCKGCGLCILWCPLKHLELSSDLNKRGVRYAKKKENTSCSGCGACFLVCPDFCIEVYEKAKSDR